MISPAPPGLFSSPPLPGAPIANSPASQKLEAVRGKLKGFWKRLTFFHFKAEFKPYRFTRDVSVGQSGSNIEPCGSFQDKLSR